MPDGGNMQEVLPPIHAAMTISRQKPSPPGFAETFIRHGWRGVSPFPHP